MKKKETTKNEHILNGERTEESNLLYGNGHCRVVGRVIFYKNKSSQVIVSFSYL